MHPVRRALAISTILFAGCYRAGPEPAAPPARAAATAEEAAYFRRNPLMVPVDGIEPGELRDSFNSPRGAGRNHGAIDIPALRGTPVVAATDGQVFRLRQNINGGITAYLSDTNRRYVYYYAHLNGYSADLTEGLKVKQGFVIGYVGTSGNAPPDTPHLHFQVMRIAPDQRDWWNGKAIDVRAFMTITGKALR
jgi:murein DD-endopeptidase MepM/ murein hydrolase activator NlpD